MQLIHVMERRQVIRREACRDSP